MDNTERLSKLKALREFNRQKNTAIRSQQYENAVDLRDLEQNLANELGYVEYYQDEIDATCIEIEKLIREEKLNSLI